MNFNEKLISLRKSKGLSQEELGAELNVSRQTISKWESWVNYTIKCNSRRKKRSSYKSVVK